MNVNDLLRRIDELRAHGESVVGTARKSDYGTEVSSEAIKGFRAACLSFISRVYGESNPFYKEFDQATNGYHPSDAKNGVAILNAIRGELAGGWLISIKSLVAAELFSDFIGMAEHLLESGYKDPAAVLAGGVLEEHLRQLCLKAGIPVDEEKNGKMVAIKSDRLNADLAKANVYSGLNQKQVTAWLALRNNAAHGKYSEYTDEQVRNYLQGIVDFMVRVSA